LKTEVRTGKLAKTCTHCGIHYTTNHQRSRFCSDRCVIHHRNGTPQLGIIQCSNCSKAFNASRRNSKFCSLRCQRVVHIKKLQVSPRRYPGIASSTIGAIGEMLVAADLLSKGFEVFRAVSSACSSDLMISKNGKVISVEVRTGRTYIHGILPSRSDHRADILAINLGDRIVYRPELGGLFK